MIADTITLEIIGLNIPEKHLQRFNAIPGSQSSPARYVFNPEDKGDYLPSITIRSLPKKIGGYFTKTEIQFSAPKIVYGNNYFGLSEADFPKLVEALANKLEYIFEGRIIDKTLLRFADTKNIAYAFNFVLEQFPDPVEYLKFVPFLSIGKRYKKARHTYYTDEDELGFCGRMFNPQVGFRIYSKGAAVINTAETIQEKDIARKLQLKQLPRKVVRIEITLQGRMSLKKHLSNITDKNAKRERNFYEVFNDTISKRILTDAFNELANELDITAIDLPIYDTDECFRICRRAGFSVTDAYTLMGRSLAVRQTGALQLKLTNDKYYDRRKRDRADRRLKNILAQNPLPIFEFKKIIQECQKQLTEFKVMKPISTS
jgi:hypothetical protein